MAGGFVMKARTIEEAVAVYMARSTRDGACLIGPQSGSRYGLLRGDGRKVLAHRAVYAVINGPIPDGLVVRHACDRPLCVEPTHLLIGTHADNERDKHERNRARVGEDAPGAYPDEVVNEVRALYAAGEMTKAEVAETTRIPLSVVDKWTKGEVRKLEPIRVRDGRFKPTGQGCGTRAGWSRHHTRGEKPCPPCLEANRVYMANYKAQRAKTREWLGAAS